MSYVAVAQAAAQVASANGLYACRACPGMADDQEQSVAYQQMDRPHVLRFRLLTLRLLHVCWPGEPVLKDTFIESRMCLTSLSNSHIVKHVASCADDSQTVRVQIRAICRFRFGRLISCIAAYRLSSQRPTNLVHIFCILTRPYHPQHKRQRHPLCADLDL